MAEENAPNQGATGEAPAEAAPPVEGDGPPPWSEAARGTSESPLEAENGGGAFSERPELYVGAAFVGGFALAMILRRIGR